MINADPIIMGLLLCPCVLLESVLGASNGHMELWWIGLLEGSLLLELLKMGVTKHDNNAGGDAGEDKMKGYRRAGSSYGQADKGFTSKCLSVY